MRKKTASRSQRKPGGSSSSQFINGTSTFSTIKAVEVEEAEKMDPEYEERVHRINFSRLDMAVENSTTSSDRLNSASSVNVDGRSGTRITATSEASTRRTSARKSSSTAVNSMNELTSSASEVATVLSLFLNGVDTSTNMFLSSKPPQNMMMEEKVSRIVEEAHHVLNKWRMQLKVGMTLEFLDTHGCKIQTSSVLQNLDGLSHPSSKIQILNPKTKKMEPYELKVNDVAIKVDKIQHWICVGSKVTPTISTCNDYPIVDIGIVPVGSIQNTAKAWNNKASFGIQRRNGHHKKEKQQTMNPQTATTTNDKLQLNSKSGTVIDNCGIPKHTLDQLSGNQMQGIATKSVQRKRKANPSYATNVERKRSHLAAAPTSTPPDAASEIESNPDGKHPKEPVFFKTNIIEEKQGNTQQKITQTVSEGLVSKPTTRHRAKEKSSLDSSTDFTWICAQCHEAECPLFTSASEKNVEEEDNELDRLVICDGPCNRAFHIPCASSAETFCIDEEWKCKDCLSSQHACVLCGEYGQDNKDVWCCARKGCGLFFHESCLEMGAFFPEVKIKVVATSDNNCVDDDNDNNLLEDAEYSAKTIKFSCPAHHCWTCDDGNPFGPKSGSLFVSITTTVPSFLMNDSFILSKFFC